MAARQSTWQVWLITTAVFLVIYVVYRQMAPILVQQMLERDAQQNTLEKRMERFPQPKRE